MPGYEEQGRLLRVWRTEVAGLTQRQVATAIFTTKSVVSMWERARRGLSFEHLHALDRFYGADGALADIALAMGTPFGLPPQTSWVHNPQGSSGPVWAWCRPRHGDRSIKVQVRWGAFAFECSSACDDQGLFLTSPVSMPNPPAWVDLQEPGWVDFGRGKIPEQLGIPTFDAFAGLRVGTGGQSPAGLVAPHLVERFRTEPRFAKAVLDFFGSTPEVVRRVFSAKESRRAVSDLTGEPPPLDYRRFTGEQYRRLRKCRCLSLAQAASLATALIPTEPVTDDQIGLLENDGRPQVRYLCARLAQVYRADGYTCLEEVTRRRGNPRFIFDFPRWWIGPIWFTLSSSNDSAVRAELRWDEGYKHLLVKAGTTFTCRKPTEEPIPFVVVCPSGWRVTAGMGMHPHAWDVNWGWSNVNDASSRGDADVHEIFLGLFGRTKEEFDRLLRDLGTGLRKPTRPLV